MKPLVVFLLSAWSVTAQSYYTNLTFSGIATEFLEPSLVATVPANTLAEVLDIRGQENGCYPGDCTVSNAGLQSLIFYGENSHGGQLPFTVLGPATITAGFYVNGSTNYPLAYGGLMLLKLTPVNGTPGGIAAVSPPGTPATVSLLSSTNLTEWQSRAQITNYGGAGYEFYRVQLQ